MSENCFVTSPHSNDVLLGRGYCSREHAGTKQLRRLCCLHRDEYLSSEKTEKNRVASKVMAQVENLNPPARFLRSIPREDAKEKGFDNEQYFGSVWQQVDRKVALTSIKQYIRDSSALLQPDDISSVGPLQTSQYPFQNATNVSQQTNSPFLGTSNTSMMQSPPLPSIMHNQMVTRGGSAGMLQYLFPQQNHGSFQQSGQVASNIGEVRESSTTEKRKLAGRHDVDQEHPLISGSMNNMESASDFSPSGGQYSSEEQIVANQLLSMLTLDEAPKFTAEDERKEREAMTQDERDDVVKDVFGESGPVVQSASKRRKVQIEATKPSLLECMKREIERIPSEAKSALRQAEEKASPSEFSNERLMIFLRREDMNPQRGAERFVTYWEERRKVFGSEKYTSKMTLSEVLSDDLPALRTGGFSLLPRLDMSGRHILLRRASADTRDGYTRESVIRVYWYLLELISQSKIGNKCDFVYLVYNATTGTLWDYDHVLVQRVYELERTCLPVRLCALHSFFPPLVAFTLKPVVFALADKHIRNRLFHYNTSQCPEALAKYGILRDMVPDEMGGTLKFDMSQWMEERISEEDSGAC